MCARQHEMPIAPLTEGACVYKLLLNDNKANHKDALEIKFGTAVKNLDLSSLPPVSLSTDLRLSRTHIRATLIQLMLVAMVTGFKCSRRHALLMVCSCTPDTQESRGARWL